MLKFWGWGGETKAERMSRLEEEVISLEKQITCLKDSLVDAEIANDRKDTNHRVDLQQLQSEKAIEIAHLERQLEIANAAIKNGIADGIAKEKREMAREALRLEGLHTARMAKLEKEYAEKEAKRDRALEADKASYRKYLRTDMNSRVDKAENLARKFEIENARLIGENTSLNISQKFYSGKQEAMTDTMNLIIKALPSVSAEITTPEVTVNNVPPMPKNNGGEQKKN